MPDVAGMWNRFGSWLLGTSAPMLPLTWMSPQSSIQTVFVPEELAAVLKDAKALDLRAAMRVPAFKRAHHVTCGVLARMPWVLYDNTTKIEPQPQLLTNSQSGVSPRHTRWGVASDSFAYGQAALGCQIGADGLPIDWMHIPFGMWSLDADGTIRVSTAIPEQYRQRIIWMPLGLGSNGMLIDAQDTITDARDIAAAYRDRIKNPIAQTILTLAADRWDGWDETEREQFRKLWMQGRSAEGGSTAMKPDWVTVDMKGDLPTDLFENGRNANRLDMANHAGLPASILEGAKQGGGSGDMHYSTEAGGAARNELWDYGLAMYADAWEARLSLDDVCGTGLSIRVDSSAFLTTPNPTTPQTSED